MSKFSLHIGREKRDCETRDFGLVPRPVASFFAMTVPRPVSKEYVV